MTVFNEKLQELAARVDQYQRTCGDGSMTDIVQLQNELKEEIENCTTLAENTLNPSMLNRDCFINFTHAMFLLGEDLYMHVLTKFPGDFERIVGADFLGFPKLLKAAIESKENISLHLYRKTNDGVTEYSEPAIHIPFMRLTLAMHHREVDFFDPREEFDAFKECVRMLCSLGANINDRDGEGDTLLCQLIRGVNPPCLGERIRPPWDTGMICEAIRFLIDMGAFPDLSGDFLSGNTPLHLAMIKFEDFVQPEMIEALMDTPFPVDLAVRNHSGFTPLSAAIAENISLEGVRLYLGLCKKLQKKFGKAGEESIEEILQEEGESKYPLLYQVAEWEPFLEDFEELSDLLISYGASVAARLDRAEGQDVRGKRLVEVVLENKDGKFSERVMDYYRKKKKEIENFEGNAT